MISRSPQETENILISVADPIQNHKINVDETFDMIYAAIKYMVKKFVSACSTLSRQLLKLLQYGTMMELDEADLRRSTVVFSPHPDDETLGCGGTIIKKKRLEADVTIVFMTDGRASHSHLHLISEDALKSIRKKEALEASCILGVEEKDIIFLDVRDGKLAENCESTIFKVVEILKDKKPEEIFVPYCKEPSSHASGDHLATNRIVVSALRIFGRKIVVNECPLAFWRNWPWSEVQGNTVLQKLRALKNGVLSNLNALRDFRYFVHVEDILEIKRDALDKHKSQMTRFIPDPRWHTFPEEMNGTLLDCFFQEREIFHRYMYQESQVSYS